MKVVVQKAKDAKVVVDGNICASITDGLVVLVGFCSDDTLEKLEPIVKKIVNLRIFLDENHVMNKSILDVKKEILSVSQFTLYADVKKGNRPSYIKALNSKDALELYNKFNELLSNYVPVKTGIFKADMELHLVNMGPTTIIIEN